MEFFKAFIYLSTVVINLEASSLNFPGENPYENVDLLPFNSQGWHGESNWKGLEKLIKTRNIKTVIEIGSWYGLSTRHIAQTLPEDGVIYAIDNWLGSPGQIDLNIFDIPNVYRQFLSNVIHAKLTHKIVPIRMDSLEASQQLTNVQPDLIYIDGYYDLTAWYPYVKGHGVLCGDDYY